MQNDADRSSQGREAMCPSCDRFIGPADVCPYCGADSVKRPALRFLRHASVILAVLGLTFLFAAAAHREIPRVRIAGITPFMNNACVRIAGKVARPPYVARRKGRVEYVSFPVDDGTDQMRVAAEGSLAQKLVDEDRLPAEGAQVDVSGRVSVSAEGVPRLRLQSDTQLTARENGGPAR